MQYATQSTADIKQQFSHGDVLVWWQNFPPVVRFRVLGSDCISRHMHVFMTMAIRVFLPLRHLLPAIFHQIFKPGKLLQKTPFPRPCTFVHEYSTHTPF